MNQIPALARVFAYLSLLTIGGGMAAFPELPVAALCTFLALRTLRRHEPERTSR